jgi:hypothetical protein
VRSSGWRPRPRPPSLARDDLLERFGGSTEVLHELVAAAQADRPWLAGAVQAAVAELAEGAAMRVLVVDDDKPRLLSRRTLAEWGYEVAEQCSGIYG